MRWANTKLIFLREIRDQLRDRRTLFMIAVLPMLMYPLLGMVYFQIAQFLREKPTSVLVLGALNLPESPPLFENDRFSPTLFSKPQAADLLNLTFYNQGSDLWTPAPEDPLEKAREAVRTGQFDAAIWFPSNFADELDRFRLVSESGVLEVRKGEEAVGPETLPSIPRPEVIYTTSNEKSQITFSRLQRVLHSWNKAIGKRNLAAVGLAPEAALPFEIQGDDLAEAAGTRGMAIWAKLLPVMLLLWALTGAFYPAIDLCAGEKERGTLETLLCSPALRSEIVVGKLLTVMLFSMATVILNLISIGITGLFLMKQMPGIGPVPLAAVGWLLVVLVPVSALFGALCLALAAMARSSKEGQYYLMPLLLIVMPLAILPMIPSVEMNLGFSLIPITNLCLWLRSAVEGQYAVLLKYAVPVLGVTVVCCFFSIRWAVDQFNRESVLFSENERNDLGLWLRHMVRDRQPTPKVGAAFLAGALILVAMFFLGLTMPVPEGFGGLVRTVMVTQLGVIVAPILILTFLLTTRPAKTLLLNRPAWRVAWKTVPMAILLAALLHPLAFAIQALIARLYPIGPEAQALQGLIASVPSFWQLFLLAAVTPAICEELAFRGFLLSGFRHSGHKWQAIALSAIFFGMTHTIVQQSIMTMMVGLVLGYLAIQSGSLLTTIAYHMTHNGLALMTTLVTPELLARHRWFASLVDTADGGYSYQTPVVIVTTLLAIVVFGWFYRLQHGETDEEQLQGAIHHGQALGDEPLGPE